MPEMRASAKEPASGPALLRVTEAATYLGISRSSTYQLINAGKIPVVRLGRLVRVPVAGLRDLIEI
jgi:excisionase family DNA binding protein